MIRDACLVIVAGGSGSRYGKNNKLLEFLSGVPAIVHSVKKLGPGFAPECRIMAVPEAEKQRFLDVLKTFAPELPFRLVSGGATRGESVRHAMAAVPDGIRYIAIHDGARPLATPALLGNVLAAARECGGAVPGHAVADTLKRMAPDGTVQETVPRENLFAVETPQCFDLALLREAYAKIPEARTDDAGVMEEAGFPVRIVPWTEPNLKLTYTADLMQLEEILKKN